MFLVWSSTNPKDKGINIPYYTAGSCGICLKSPLTMNSPKKNLEDKNMTVELLFKERSLFGREIRIFKFISGTDHDLLISLYVLKI